MSREIPGPAGHHGPVVTSPPPRAGVIKFGPFLFAPSERSLTRDGVPVALGGRAIDILAALVARANEIVGKRELLAEVWPDTTVEEGSLRFHVSGLRKALGDGRDGARYIATVGGRGYCFVAGLSPGQRTGGDRPDELPEISEPNLPQGAARLVGRAEDARSLATHLAAARLVTIVGAGGIGKTALAIAVGHDLAASFGGAVLFVDLGTLADPALVAPTLASILGLSVSSDDPTPALLAHLRERRLLLILDTCEHLIDAVASLASAILSGTVDVRLLATSREALRIAGEHVFPLSSLHYPAGDVEPTAASALTYPAVQLFLERARAGGGEIAWSEAAATTVAAICRRLDGIALALELAAGRISAHGLPQVARLLDEHFELLWPGHRTAPPRQRTLQATLDWSYGLLADAERLVLRQLTAFAGSFSLEDASAVLTSATRDRTEVLSALDELVAKSIVSARPSGETMRYRLLDTTRAYLLQLAPDERVPADLAARHADHYRLWLAVAGTRWPALSDPSSRAVHLAALDNARAALEWAFGPGGETDLGIQLAVAAGPVLLSMSLLAECQRWSERAIAVLGADERDGVVEMHLQGALGISLMFMHGGHEAALAALTRSLAIAEDHGDTRNQLSLLGPLNMFHLRIGDFREALRCAERSREMIGAVSDPAVIAVAHCILGTSLHFVGAMDEARRELETALSPPARGAGAWTTTGQLGFEAKSLAEGILARCLWLQGLEDEALSRAASVVREARRIDHPVSLCIALIWATTVFLWADDLGSAERHTAELSACAEANALMPYRTVARGFEAELALRRGEVAAGLDRLQAAITDLHATPYELLTRPFEVAFARGLAASGRVPEALTSVESTIREVEHKGDRCYRPELLRLKGQLLLLSEERDGREARSCLVEALRESRRQGARAWELRTAADLAHFLAERGHPTWAENLLGGSSQDERS